MRALRCAGRVLNAATDRVGSGLGDFLVGVAWAVLMLVGAPLAAGLLYLGYLVVIVARCALRARARGDVVQPVMGGCCDCFPHGPDEACTCSGCWACIGRVVGCTCDIAWDCEHPVDRGVAA
ncbi:MAG: hypothetical protein ACJ71Y_14115 [Blastococcus sp.]